MPASTLLAGSLALAMWAGAPRQSMAQAAGQAAGTLPAAVITAASAEPLRPQIKQFVDAQAGRLVGEDAREAAAARQALFGPLARGAGGGPSGPFLSVYAQQIDDALAPAARNPDPRVRLNAAIVVARVARESGSPDLEEAIAALLADESPGVALWGVKAAAAVLPSIRGNRVLVGQDELTPAVVEAVRKHPNSGPIAQEGYAALILNLDNREAVSKVPPNFVQTVLPGALENVHAVLAFRLDQYGPGATPPEPAVERQPVNFLVDRWGDQPAAMQRQTIERLAALLAAASGAMNDPNVQDEGLRALVNVVGSGFRVIGQKTGNDALDASARALAGAGPAVGPDQIRQSTVALIGVLRTAFPDATLPGDDAPAAAADAGR